MPRRSARNASKLLAEKDKENIVDKVNGAHVSPIKEIDRDAEPGRKKVSENNRKTPYRSKTQRSISSLDSKTQNNVSLDSKTQRNISLDSKTQRNTSLDSDNFTQPLISELKKIETPKESRRRRSSTKLLTIRQQVKDVIYIIKDGTTVTSVPFIDKLSAVYSSLGNTKRIEFQNALVAHMRNVFIFIHTINQGTKILVTQNQEADRIFQFILDLLPELLKVESEEQSTQKILADSQRSLSDSAIVEASSIITTVLEALIDVSSVKTPVIRIKACTMIGNILALLNDDIEVMEYLIEKLTARLLDRTTDINAEVRLAAFSALPRLQNYRDPDDDVVAAYCNGMQFDENDKIRKVCTDLIGLNKITLLNIIDRCRDMSPIVRRAAYLRIAKKVKLNVLKPDQILNLIERGLHDDDERVRDIVAKSLISAWLSHVKPRVPDTKGTIIDFIHVLDPVDAKSAVEKTMDCYLNQWENPDDLIKHSIQLPSFLDPETLLPYDTDISYLPSISFVWYHLFSYVRSKDTELLADALPSLPAFIELLKRLTDKLSVETDVEHMEDDHILASTIEEESLRISVSYLLQGIEFFEYCDPVSRNALNALPNEMFMKLSLVHINYLSPYIFSIARTVSKNEPNTNETKVVLKWIETIRENTLAEEAQAKNNEVPDLSIDVAVIEEHLAQINEIKMMLANLEDELETAISEQKFGDAQIITNKKREFITMLDDLQANKNTKKQIMSTNLNTTIEEDIVHYTQLSATKSIILLCELLKTQRKRFQPGLDQFLPTFIHPVLLTLGQGRHWDITEERAAECLALFGSLSKEIGKDYFTTFCELASNENSEKPYSPKIQMIGLKTITDFSLAHPVTLLDDGALSPELTGSSSMETTDSSQMKPGLQNKVADILLSVSIKLDEGYNFGGKEEDREQLASVVVCSISKILFSGRYAVALLLRMILYALKENKNGKELRQDLYRLMAKKEVIDSLPQVMKKLLLYIILQAPDLNTLDVLKFFGRISNPKSLRKVYAFCHNNREVPIAYIQIPLDMCAIAVEVIAEYSTHPLINSMAAGLSVFNCNVPIEEAFSGKLEQAETDTILAAWKNLCDKVEIAKNEVVERRVKKHLEEYYERVHVLLENYYDSQKRSSLSSNQSKSKKKRSASNLQTDETSDGN